MPVRLFLEEISVQIGELGKADGSPQYGRASPNLLKGLKRTKTRKVDFAFCLNDELTHGFSALSAPGPQDFPADATWDPHHCIRLTALAFLGLQLEDGRSGTP